MTQQQQTTTLTAIFSDVLANLAFMFADEDPVECSPGDVWLEATISYHGPMTGTIRFRCTQNFAVLLAANLLGIDPEDDQAESKGIDALKEFMNVLCGQLVTGMYGADEVFDLTIPEVEALPETPDLSIDDNPELSTLSVSGYQVQLSHTQGTSGDDRQ